MMIRVSKAKLKVALDRWAFKSQAKTINLQENNIKEIHKSNANLETDIRKTDNEIDISDESIKQLASKRLRKLCINAFENNLRYYIAKWREGSLD
jgi:septal ring factor EnvC (AmiA/AmiB activator)